MKTITKFAIGSVAVVALSAGVARGYSVCHDGEKSG